MKLYFLRSFGVQFNLFSLAPHARAFWLIKMKNFACGNKIKLWKNWMKNQQDMAMAAEELKEE